jgi:ectoine hydroxylase-related dioxygenase (phytanoyl-CoA dioxygenase family)
MGKHRLNESELLALEADGYVIRERLFDHAEVAAIASECETLLERLVAGRRGARSSEGSYTFEKDDLAGVIVKWEGETDVVHGLEPFAHLSEPIAALTLDSRFVDPMVDLTGADAPMLFTEKLNLTRPRHGGVNPLHQDMPYWSFAGDASRIATAMLFLDDADRGNGTLEVVPGSHRDGLWPGRTDVRGFGRLEIDPTLADGLETVAVEVPAGSFVYFGSTLVHRSAPNTSDRERRSLLLSYRPPGNKHLIDAL